MTIKHLIPILSAGIALLGCQKEESMKQLSDRVFAVAEAQYVAMDSQLTPTTLPRSYENDKFIPSNVKWWCSGFYPGSLWYIYDYSGHDAVRELAERNTEKLDTLQWRTDDHDIGFQLNCSYGNGLRLTGNEAYRAVLNQGARSLATRFNPTAGVVRSWDFTRPGCDWQFPVIIDNMMNLELLLDAGKATGNDSLTLIACTHANTTMRNHFRDDYTTWHLVDYDPATGSVRGKQTVQGYADNSAWARGQAWALYGYTMMFRHTGYQNYLDQATHVADMLLKRLPADGVPYWDFDVPVNDSTPRDASAAAIMASALIDLSRYAQNPDQQAAYLATAERQLRTLASPDYLAEPGTNGCFLLKHSAGNVPGNSEVDVPLSYADYYFLEALVRYRDLQSDADKNI
jgi:hypothetical protein